MFRAHVNTVTLHVCTQQPLTYDCINRLSPMDEKLSLELKYTYDAVGSEDTAPRVYNLGTTKLSGQLHAPAALSPRKGPPPRAGRFGYTGVPPYPRVIRSRAYRGYVKPWIITNAIYNVIFV
jgi:hypothetical protein